MPQVFKGLATVNVWALFIIGWISLIAGYVHLVGLYFDIEIADFSIGVPPVWMPLVGGFTCLALSVVLMKLRQMLD
jgi:hypothetical protein